MVEWIVIIRLLLLTVTIYLVSMVYGANLRCIKLSDGKVERSDSVVIGHQFVLANEFYRFLKTVSL